MYSFPYGIQRGKALMLRTEGCESIDKHEKNKKNACINIIWKHKNSHNENTIFVEIEFSDTTFSKYSPYFSVQGMKNSNGEVDEVLLKGAKNNFSKQILIIDRSKLKVHQVSPKNKMFNLRGDMIFKGFFKGEEIIWK